MDYTHKTLLVPVLYGEGETQILVAEDVMLPEPALKVLEVRTEIKHLTGQVCKGKVIFQGVLHKQIIYVQQKVGLVMHHQADTGFNGFVEVHCAAPGMELKFLEECVEKDCSKEELYEPHLLHEKHMLKIKVGVFRIEKVCVHQHC